MLRRIYRCGRSLVHRMANSIDPPVLILLYHRVTTLASDPYQLAVSPENFRAQMKYLRQTFPVAGFEEDWTDTPKPCVVVTFDDGYADNLLEALPILEDVGVPATFFITTGSIETKREFWWDELESIIFGQQVLPSHFVLEDGKYGKKWLTGTEGERQVFHWQMVAFMKKVDYNRREDWLQQLRQWAGAKRIIRASHRPLTFDELRILVESPLATIGAHA